MKIKKLLLAGLFAGSLLQTTAQTKENPFAAGLHFGSHVYMGELAGGFDDAKQSLKPAIGLSLTKYYNASWDLMGNAHYGMVDYVSDLTAMPASQPMQGFKGNLLNFNMGFKYKLNNGYILKEESVFAPFAFAGFGTGVYSADHIGARHDIDFNFPIGGGVNFNLSERLQSSIMYTYNYTMSDNLDGWDNINLNSLVTNYRDRFHYISVGVAYKFNVGKDTDGDGIKDKFDACIDEPGMRDMEGCPDSDKDGVKDSEDECPNVAGEDKGCPTIKDEAKEIMSQAMKGLQFETGSAKIKTESYVVLDNVAKVMMSNRGYKLYISGHTDNTGGKDLNLQLSKNRAAAAKAYLVEKGLATNRIFSEGYGDTKPVADNGTAAGRAANRRVEFEIRVK